MIHEHFRRKLQLLYWHEPATSGGGRTCNLAPNNSKRGLGNKLQRTDTSQQNTDYLSPAQL